jgi:adenine-specific DNA-methyltransferase
MNRAWTVHHLCVTLVRFVRSYAVFSLRVGQSVNRYGNKKYEKWYAYGRNQALTLSGYKLLFPYIAEHPYFVLADEPELLFYNGYAIISESKRKLRILQRVLSSSVFSLYLSKSSKPYDNGYLSFGKNYIQRFGICSFSPEEEEVLLKSDNSSEVERLIQKKHRLR